MFEPRLPNLFTYNPAESLWETDRRTNEEKYLTALNDVYALIEQKHQDQIETGIDTEIFSYVGWIGHGFAVPPLDYVVCDACKVAIKAAQDTAYCVACGRGIVV